MATLFPDSFPEDSELTRQQQSSESTLLDTAQTYLPDVQRAMSSVGQAAQTYLPQSVAAYLRASSPSSRYPDLAPPPELRTLSTGGSRLASLQPLRVDSVATTSTSDAMHTSSAVCLRPVPPLSSTDTDPHVEQGVPTPPASLAESPGAQLSSALSLSTPPVPQNTLSAPTRTPLPALPSPEEVVRLSAYRRVRGKEL
ncbi:hypothetical protein FB451DRAFT_1454494 [Mycena latifolia]|nr:hypothetical protein FB451DRAFT_1454494 [Mycena latifolia]